MAQSFVAATRSEAPVEDVDHDSEGRNQSRPSTAHNINDNISIVSLPQEILECIIDMAQASPLDVCIDGLATLYRDESPIIASHVCRYWRSIALDNPLWWTSIIITPPWNPRKIEAYLRRSKQCILDLRIYIHLNYHKFDEPESLPSLANFGPIRELISPHLSRCRLIHIQGVFNSEKDLASRLVEPLAGIDMPHLEEFIFDGEVRNSYDCLEDVALFSSAPRLRDLRLGGIGLLNLSPPPMSTVTTLHLSRGMDQGHLTFQYVGNMVATCSCLTSLSVYDDLLSRSSFTSESIGTCKAPLLETLQIFGNMLKVSELLLFLSAPNLQELLIAPFADGDLTLLLNEPADSHHKRFPLLKTLTLAPARPEAVAALDVASHCFPRIGLLILANLYIEELETIFSSKDVTIFPNLLDLGLTALDKDDVRIIPTIYHSRKNNPLRTIFLDKASMQNISSQYIPDGITLAVADLWETQRKSALYSHIVDLFVGQA